MGVQGLKAQLELYYSPEVVTLHQEQGKGQVLLVDASAVKLQSYIRLGFTANDPPENWAELFYQAICAYFQVGCHFVNVSTPVHMGTNSTVELVSTLWKYEFIDGLIPRDFLFTSGICFKVEDSFFIIF